MSKRKIIRIDEEKCTGCGNCVTGCHEGALQIINGKAKLVKEDFCDGLGACIKTCPTDALIIEEREAADFDEKAMIAKKEQKDSTQETLACGCPGTAVRFKPSIKLNTTIKTKANNVNTGSDNITVIQPEIQQWPLQLHLVSPDAPYFKDQELVVLSTCSPIASPDINWKFLRGRAVVIACPKLDRTDPYSEKLAAIFTRSKTTKVHIVMMEVPCCQGLKEMVNTALQISGRHDLTVEEHIVKIPL